MTKLPFLIGDPAPYFVCRSPSNPRLQFDTVAGKYLVLCFVCSAGNPKGQAIASTIETYLRDRFDDKKASAFLISADHNDESQQRLRDARPGVHILWDDEREVCRLFGVYLEEEDNWKPMTLVLDPTLRVIARFSHDDPDKHRSMLEALMNNLPPTDGHARVPLCAPVLIVPRVFEPDFCKHLIEYYEKCASYDSGFMREGSNKTKLVSDQNFKRRRDCDIDDEDLKQAYRSRLARRLLPEIKRAFQFNATHIERYIVARYNAEDGGFFRAHRDNTTRATAHRRFACSINLNTEFYEGGDLCFPEFGTRTYRAPTGGAVVFSCSLLHEAQPVTRGTRYATLPFFYDEEGANIRHENLKYLDDSAY